MSALDAKLREQMQIELARLQQDVGITFVIVTHDQDEALSMADRIAVMEKGQVCQIATPEGLYERPNSRFVADFIGKVNLFDAQVVGASDSGVRVEIDRVGTLAVPHDGPASGTVSVAVRPEKIRLSREAPSGDASVRGRIADWAYYGDNSHMFVETEDGLRLAVTVQNETRRTVDAVDTGDEVWLSWSATDALILDR